MTEFEWNPEEDDELLAAWDEMDRRAADIVADACRDVLADPPSAAVAQAAAAFRVGVEGDGRPYEYFRNACAWTAGAPAGDDDTVLWLTGIAATVSPMHDPQTDVEEQSAVAALEHLDWVALVLGLVGRGVGAVFDAEEFSMPVEVLAPLWEAVGVIDEHWRLTEAGRWGLPAALVALWGSDQDETDVRLDEDHVATALRLLAEEPMTPEALTSRLRKEGIVADARTLTRSLIWRPEIFEFEDGRWGHLPTLVEGCVLTHRLSEEEHELGVVVPTGDLELFDFLAMDGMPLTDGGQVVERRRSQGALLPVGSLGGLTGPDGWLDGFAPGDLVAFRYVRGELALERVEPANDDAWTDHLVALARRLARKAHDEDERGVTGVDLAMTLLREDPGTLSVPRAPWSELLAVPSLELHLGLVGLPGTNWHDVPDWLRQDEQVAYRRWREALLRYVVDDTLQPDELVELSAGLRGAVEELVAEDVSRDPVRAAPLLAAMLEATRGAAQATPLYLSARLAEARGEGARMSELLEAAVAADPHRLGALADLAELRALAGDAREAKRLYSLAEVDPQLPEVQALRGLVEPAPGPGRNKPCPCGSGKKYKVCHGRTDRHPLGERGRWLRVKVNAFLQREVNHVALLRWAERWTGEDLYASEPEAVRSAMDDAFAWDLALFDGGVLASFLRLHGPSLPEDERELVESWLGSERRLLEVLDARPGIGIRARDLLSGEDLDVQDRLLSRGVRPEDLVYGRLLDEGDGVLRLWDDPLGVPRAMRSGLVELLRSRPDAMKVIHFLRSGVAQVARG